MDKELINNLFWRAVRNTPHGSNSAETEETCVHLFAALIAEECAKVADAGGFHDDDGPEWIAATIRAEFCE